MGPDITQIYTCLTYLITRPSTCRDSKVVFVDAVHTLYAFILGKKLLHLFLEDEVRVEESSVLSSRAASCSGLNSVKRE